MNEIKCPECGKLFKVDESGFADIVKQVRDREFEKAIHEREALLEADKEKAVQLAEANTKNVLQTETAKKDAEIAELKAKIEATETEKKLAIAEALAVVEKERDTLSAELYQKDDAAKLTEVNMKNTFQTETAKRDVEIAELKAKVQMQDTEKQLAISEAVNKVEKERDALVSELKSKDAEKLLLEATLKDKYTAELKTKDEMIAYYKDMKAKLSTKMVTKRLKIGKTICPHPFVNTGHNFLAIRLKIPSSFPATSNMSFHQVS